MNTKELWTPETQQVVSRYRQVRTEEQGIALAREEGVPEDMIAQWTPGWLQHYQNTAKQIVHGIRELRAKERTR